MWALVLKGLVFVGRHFSSTIELVQVLSSYCRAWGMSSRYSNKVTPMMTSENSHSQDT